MAEIVLATLNARYVHCAFGLRYLLANMGELKPKTVMLEFTIQQPPLEILDAILEHRPRIVGFGVYIWNLDETTRLVADLKRLCPEIVVVLGGPEVSYEADELQIIQLADHVISGEADLAFAAYCRERLVESPGHTNESGPNGNVLIPNSKMATAPLPLLTDLVPPYDLYSNDDISHRVVYVEASRGCPFTCEFCLSALDIPVRQFPVERFLASLTSLLNRGTRQFKFVDRTFNLNIRVGRAILEFFLENMQPGIFLHFEMIPDRLPEALKELIVRFPPGALQFEVGIQTFNERVCELISRHQDNNVVEENLNWLRNHTGVHVHADLIFGLPGETLESFAEGFDRLVRLGPNEIQVGILKRLRGTPIIRHDLEWKMVYSPHTPYEILSTKLLDFSAVQEIRRFSKYWDAVANSGNFVETLPLLWSMTELEDHAKNVSHSPFAEFRRLVAWLYERERKTHGIALSRLLELIFQYLTEVRTLDVNFVAAALWRDYQRGGRSDKPHCLRPFIDGETSTIPETSNTQSTATREHRSPKRQSRHWVN